MNKVALVTGASKGIGKAILKKFIEDGIRVIGTYNSSSVEANKLIDELGEDNLEFIKFDLAEPSSHAVLMEKLPDTVDILVNNAGVGSKTVEAITEDKFEQDIAFMKINALGPLWLTQALIKADKKCTKVINISSVGGGIFHFPGFRYADGMSKSAITFMTKQLAAENTNTSLDVFAVCPGATDTDMFNASSINCLSKNEQKLFIASLPKGRLINPREIAELCSFLIKKESQILHGAVIDSSLGLGVNPGIMK